MPVPDEFVLAYDYRLCEICGRGNVPDPDFVHVVVDNEKSGAEHEKRWYAICKDCRGRARTDKDYERYITEKVFAMKLGRRVRIRENEAQKMD